MLPLPARSSLAVRRCPSRLVVSIGVAAASAMVFCACAPAVLWRARSVDLRHVVEVRQEGALVRVVVDGLPGDSFEALAEGAVVFMPDGAAHFVVREAGSWRLVGPTGIGPPFLEVELPIRTTSRGPLFSAADREGWHLVDGLDIGPAFEAATSEVVIASESRVVYVGRGSASERVVVAGVLGPPFDDVHLLSLANERTQVVYAGRLERSDHIVFDGRVGPAAEEVLELVSARGAPAVAAILGTGAETELVHATHAELELDTLSFRSLGSAPLLTHLRISDDGAHIACLSAAVDGQSIEVWLDGQSIARHRRVEGERLAFVPGEGARLVWLAEDAQGLVVYDGDRASERFEELEGPRVAPGRVGFIGRRGGGSEVWVDGVRVAEEAYAAELRLGPGTSYAFVARRPHGRFVVTRRGSWPVPRFFVDTLVLDPSGEHWAGLVPDAAERQFAVWVDGEEAALLEAQDVLRPAMAAGLEPTTVLLAVVEAVLERSVER